MDDWKLKHVVECLTDLNGKPSSESHRDSLEIIILDELIQINAKHFKHDTDMTSKSEFLFDSDNILHIVMVIFSESLKDFDFDFSLFVELVPIL